MQCLFLNRQRKVQILGLKEKCLETLFFGIVSREWWMDRWMDGQMTEKKIE